MRFLLGSVMIRHSQKQKYRGTDTTLMSLPTKVSEHAPKPCTFVHYITYLTARISDRTHHLYLNDGPGEDRVQQDRD